MRGFSNVLAVGAGLPTDDEELDDVDVGSGTSTQLPTLRFHLSDKPASRSTSPSFEDSLQLAARCWQSSPAAEFRPASAHHETSSDSCKEIAKPSSKTQHLATECLHNGYNVTKSTTNRSRDAVFTTTDKHGLVTFEPGNRASENCVKQVSVVPRLCLFKQVECRPVQRAIEGGSLAIVCCENCLFASGALQAGFAGTPKREKTSYTVHMSCSCAARELDASCVVDAPPPLSLVVCSPAYTGATHDVGTEN